jgi:hypothetical protein
VPNVTALPSIRNRDIWHGIIYLRELLNYERWMGIVDRFIPDQVRV